MHQAGMHEPDEPRTTDDNFDCNSEGSGFKRKSGRNNAAARAPRAKIDTNGNL